MKLLNRGLKYNLHYRHKDWIKILAIEADAAISVAIKFPNWRFFYCEK
jgi:hypothetical protein